METLNPVLAFLIKLDSLNHPRVLPPAGPVLQAPVHKSEESDESLQAPSKQASERGRQTAGISTH